MSDQDPSSPFDAAALRGAFTALITPFRDGAVDHDALAALVERQIDGGIDGLVPCGTTGEAATTSTSERLAIIETVVEAADGRVPVLAGTGSNDTDKTIEFTRRVAEIEGVDYALVVVPYYNKPSDAMLLRHFRRVADEGGLPVVLYNVPGRTVVSLEPETIAVLAEHERIVGIKEATGDLVFDTHLVELLGETDFRLMSGDDFTTFPFLSVGGHGCVSVISNLVPDVMSEMCAAARDGDFERARELHVAIQPLARFAFSDANPVPTKVAAAALGWCTPEVRGPLSLVDEEALDAGARAVLGAFPTVDFPE
jgi:4-hydroxy-tetrahydrodipicolinate synthase